MLVVNGPVAVGKSTVANAASALLIQRGIAHTFIDVDRLTETFPRPAEDPFGHRLALRNLRDVWANCAAEGSRNLILARVIETARTLEEFANAVPGAAPTLCLLRARPETLIRRVGQRETGTRRDWYEARSLELARSLDCSALADFIVDTDGRAPDELAEEIVDRVTWETAA